MPVADPLTIFVDVVGGHSYFRPQAAARNATLRILALKASFVSMSIASQVILADNGRELCELLLVAPTSVAREF